MIRAIALAAALFGTAGAAQASHPFDGRWEVTITCPAAQGGARGYVLRFPATVQASMLTASYRGAGDAGELDLSGPIAADGTAPLVARGLTGDPAATIGRVNPRTPYGYNLPSRFQGDRGTGTRTGTRPCEAAFRRSG